MLYEDIIEKKYPQLILKSITYTAVRKCPYCESYVVGWQTHNNCCNCVPYYEKLINTAAMEGK